MAIPGSPGQHDTYWEEGMTLRDYFAGQALVGELSCAVSETCVDALVKAACDNNQTPEERIAWNCYKIADAMLLARTGKATALAQAQPEEAAGES